ncbi:hypothetical protein VTN96DRAFT_2080 [Rasamsonia emersonii]
MATTSGCLLDSDNQFGPRVNIECRSFDFTLLFEDAFFTVLPAAIFLLLLPPRLQFLRSSPVKLTSYRLAIYKLSLLAVLFVLHVLFTAVQVRMSSLHTRVSMTSGILNIIATFAAAVLSFMEDQRSVEPSDILVIYFSASSILALPRLRSLWLIPSVDACRGLWTTIYIFTVAMLFVESARKTKILRPLYQGVTKEQICGFWGRSFFIWVLPFFQAGYSKVLQIQDLPEVDDDLQGQDAGEKLQAAWKTAKSRHGLLRATFRAYRWPFLSGVVPRLVLSAFTFCQPFLITATVDYMGKPATVESNKYGQALVGAYVLVYLCLAVSKAVYWRQTYRLHTMIRSGLISMTYRQTTLLKANDVKDTAAIILMGTDVERIVANLRNIHETWASILEVGVAIWLLERQVFVACIVPAIISLASVLAMVPVSTRSGEAQKQWNKRVEKRLAVTSSMLGDMKAVKMLGLTDILFTLISKFRKIELKTSERFRKLIIWQVVFSNVPLDFAPFATFAVFAIISVVRKDGSLLSAPAFTSLSLIALLTEPLFTFCQSVPSLLQAIACFQRIEVYFLKKPAPTPGLSTSTQWLPEFSNGAMELRHRQTTALSDTPLVSFKKADISWSPETEIVLHDLNMNIRKGITMIIGPVGSGKSALIESILGETALKSGSTTAPLSRVAYCSQSPWIMNTTIRHNITGGSEFDQKWYEFTISACGLEEDLEKIPGGDMCKAGSNGVSLSGGQKQRVALARAVYSKLPIVILDDVFSGLDSKSISLISSRLFSKEGHFRETGTSVILATHTLRMLPYADEIIVLDNGRIADTGSYEEIFTRMPEIAAKSLTAEDDAPSSVEESAVDKKVDNPQTNVAEEAVSKDVDHLRRDGTWAVYAYYCRSAGYITVILFALSAAVCAFCSNFSTLWLQWWVEANEQQPNKQLGMYLGVYSLFFALSFFGLIACCWLLLITIINNTALNLHSDLLTATLRAPFSFFQNTDTGSTTNRFSQDMELIDMMLPVYAINFVEGTFSCFVKLIILCAVGKYLAVCVPFLAVVLSFVQLYYLRTSRQVRLLDIEAKAPLYTHFLETVRGISTVRAFTGALDSRNRANAC